MSEISFYSFGICSVDKDPEIYDLISGFESNNSSKTKEEKELYVVAKLFERYAPKKCVSCDKDQENYYFKDFFDKPLDPSAKLRLFSFSCTNVDCIIIARKLVFKTGRSLSAKDPNGKQVTRCKTCKQYFEKIQKCSLCYGQYYCGKECQKKDWARHKKEECLDAMK